MIQNFVAAEDLRKREPELARLKSADGELEALIDKAFGDFCLQMREERVSVPSTTEPIYFYKKKNIVENSSVKVKVGDYDKRIINRFVIEKKITVNDGDNRFLLYGIHNGGNLIKEITIDNKELISFKFPVSYPKYDLRVVCNGDLDMTVNCYLTESPFDTCIEFLALSYTFESLIKTADIYIEKADRYRRLYEDRFTKLAAAYSSGLYATVETIGALR